MRHLSALALAAVLAALPSCAGSESSTDETYNCPYVDEYGRDEVTRADVESVIVEQYNERCAVAIGRDATLTDLWEGSDDPNTHFCMGQEWVCLEPMYDGPWDLPADDLRKKCLRLAVICNPNSDFALK